MVLDAAVITALITSSASLLLSIFNRVHSSKCFGANGIDLEFDTPTTSTTNTIPMSAVSTTAAKA